MSAVSLPRSQVPKMGCGYVVCGLLVAAGLALIVAMREQRDSRRTTERWMGLSFGAMLCVAGVALIAPMRREVERAKERARRETEKPEQPWTWDPAWTNPRGIVQARGRHAGIRLFIALTALGMTLPVVSIALPRELARQNYAALLILVFPLVGGTLLFAAARDAWRRRKYGLAHFIPAELPLPWGAEVAGMIVVDRRLTPTDKARVVLDCWRTTVTRQRNRRTQREDVVSHTEREIAPDDFKSSAGDTQVFVQLPIRGGSPTTMSKVDANVPSYEWRLRVEVPTAGADFVAEFTLPVFAVAGRENAPGAEPPVRMPRDRAEIWRVAGIREEPLAGAVGGHALAFPAGIARSLVWTPVLMAAPPAIIAGAVWFADGPSIVAIACGAFAGLVGLTIPPLWNGGGEHVWIEGGAICVRRGAGPVRRVTSAQIQTIEPRRSVAVGTEQFFRIQARQRPEGERRFGRRFVIVSLVRGDEAAAEAVAWIEEHLTRAEA